MNPIGKAAIFMIEVVSQFVRVVSLSVRSFAKHPRRPPVAAIHGRRTGRVLGLAALGALTFRWPSCVLHLRRGQGHATLQAFIFSTLTAISIGGATNPSSEG